MTNSFFSVDLSYKPLDDLLAHIRETRPDVLVLCGPFADASHRLLDPSAMGSAGGFSNGDPPDSLELVRRIMREHVIAGLKGSGGVQCVIVPSLSDLHSTCVYPQPSFDAEVILPGPDGHHSERLPLLLSNPCTFRLNEIVISISTADILVHLSGNEASRLTGDRLSRLSRHLIQQVCQSSLPFVFEHLSLQNFACQK
jgi:DNA polymerase alpha subunit B